MTILELKAQQDALQKIATTRDPVRALAEFVWNALDADATHVSVTLGRNALTTGLNEISVLSKCRFRAQSRDEANWAQPWRRRRA